MSLQVRGSIYHFKEIADHYTGVSSLAYKFEWSKQLYQQGTVRPFFLGGEGDWTHYAPENFEIFSFLGTKFEDKRACFSLKKM